jgi:hypothetical protein
MRSTATRRLGFDALELRFALSAISAASSDLPLYTIGTGHGTIAAAHASADITVTISPESFAQGKATTVFGIKTVPDPGSALAPAVLSATSADGHKLVIIHGQAFSPQYHAWDQSYVDVNRPGPLTITIGGRGRSTGSFGVQVYLPGDTNGDHRVDFGDLATFQHSFNTHAGNPDYSVSADANQNGYVGHDDGRFIERNLSPLTPQVPLNVDLSLAPGEQILSPHSEGLAVSNSGGLTRQQDVIVIGHTTPGSIVFVDNGLGDYKFNGAATFADARGRFEVHYHLHDQLTNTEYLVVDPYLQQKIRAFPIMRIVNKGATG